ncbi:ferredoxin [candidate division KSB1 bacterium 4484_188]|nr:MAG: ferredoxin [candidate division KSB1 bacterium 4484_188]
MQQEHFGGMGGGGNCVCPKCGFVAPHRSGIPCREDRCPKCGAKMLREGGYHHDLLLKKKKQKK